jgi:hypothetical protein
MPIPPNAHRIPESLCPGSGFLWNGAALSPDDPVDAPPTPGCFVVCGGCGGVLVFGDDMRPRGLKQEEIDEILSDPGLIRRLGITGEAVRATRAAMN